jgi:hypothetical protein
MGFSEYSGASSPIITASPSRHGVLTQAAFLFKRLCYGFLQWIQD